MGLLRMPMSRVVWLASALVVGGPVHAQTPPPAPSQVLHVPPSPAPAPGEVRVSLDFAPDTSLYDLSLFFAQLRQINLVIGNAEELRGQRVTIVAHQPVTIDAAWQTYLDALSAAGYRLDQTQQSARIVKVGQGMPSVLPTLRTGSK